MANIEPSKKLKTYLAKNVSKMFLDDYFHTDTRNFCFGDCELEPSEIDAANLLIDCLKPTTFVRIPKVDKPESIATPDFLIDGIQYEVKAPKSVGKINDRIREAKKQVGSKGFIVLSTYNCRREKKKFLAEAMTSARKNKLDGFYYIEGRNIKYIPIKK